jgi:hypothetical protein
VFDGASATFLSPHGNKPGIRQQDSFDQPLKRDMTEPAAPAEKNSYPG